MAFYTKIRIILTIFIALVLSVSVYYYLKTLRDECTVIITNQDIDARQWVSKSMLKEISIRKTDKSLLAPDSISSFKDFDLAVSKLKIKKGMVVNKNDLILGTKQFLLENGVIDENNKINDSYFIGNNKRILTVRVDAQGAVLNKLKIGDFVDVVLTVGNDLSSFSTMILQHIEVYDVEKLKNGGGNASQNISLILDPQMAVDLSYAKRNGKIDLLLNPVKGEEEIVYPTNIDKFLNQTKK